ncbi:restriction endonuclease subunit S [Desulfococcaceae bacterium HSG8]|nr:restriction endonuclease subunit S [Desulfococcaceae bacterium HSG8]
MGDFPNDWRRGKLKEFFVLQRGSDLTKDSATPGKFPVISSSGISYYHDVAKVNPPGVVTGRKGSLGKVFYVDEPFWPHDTTLWVNDFKGNDPKFVCIYLENMQLEKWDAATSVPTLNRNNILGIITRFPPLPEQKKSQKSSAYGTKPLNSLKSSYRPKPGVKKG